MPRGLGLAVALALVASGCVLPLELPGATERGGPTVWERGLATYVETPAVAATRSEEARRSGVSQPGDPGFADFDAAMLAWMARYGIPAGQIALMHEGKLRYERGYGHVDEAETKPADALTMFRVASVTKPMTGAVVAMQVEQGLYDWSDPVFCLGDEPAPRCILRIDPPRDRPVQDARLRQITVAQLVDHSAGWGHAADIHLFGDGAVAVADALGVPSPPPAWRTAQYMLGEDLTYDPGRDHEYCNMCYLVLGLVAESASGATLGALYDAYLFRPLEIEGDIEPGHTLLAERNAREPFYACEGGNATSVYEPNTTACPADGGIDLDMFLAAGGMISTAGAAASVYEVYESIFTEQVATLRVNGHTGGLPGTAAFVGTVEGTPVGEVQYAVLLNKAGFDDPAYGMDVFDLEKAILALATAWAASESQAPALA